jgi:Ca2+-binding RTX toxin-like protein
MTIFAFTSVAGTRIAFDPARDQLAFSIGFAAAGLTLSVVGGDLLVAHGGLWVRLADLGAVTALGDPNLAFADGSVARFDASGPQTLLGGAGGDYFSILQGGADVVVAGAGDDRLVAGAALDADDRLDGGPGTDTLLLAGPLDVTLGPATVTGIERILVGGGGAVRLVLHDATAATATPAPGAVFTVDATGQLQAQETLRLDGRAVLGTAMALLGGAGADTLLGGGGNDRLEGGASNDSLAGGPGDDTLFGGAGADLLRGGSGEDLFLYTEPGVAQSAPAAPDRILDFEGAGAPGGDLIALPSALRLGRPIAFGLAPLAFDFGGYGGPPQLPEPMIGDGFADLVWRYDPEDATAPFRIWLDADDDGRIGPNDLLLRLAPAEGEAPDRLAAADFLADIAGWRGTPGDDLIAAGALDDSAWGEGGNDTILGGPGADQLWGGPGADLLDGGEHGDILRGGPGSDTLSGGEGPDTLYAEDSNPFLLDAPGDRNLLLGGPGDDLLIGGNGRDTLLGEDGNDSLFGGAGDDLLDGGAGGDLIYGDAGNDTLEGGAGADWLHGGAGDDRIVGGSGKDTLVGGPGRDTLLGGADADLFVVELHLPGAPASSGAAPDRIEDFAPAEGDRIGFDSPDGFVMTPDGPMPLLWRGVPFSGPPLDVTGGGDQPPLGFVLAGKDVGDGYVQVCWLPLVEDGVAVGGWLVADLDRDSVLGAQDMVVRIRGTNRLREQDFAAGTFLGRAGSLANDSMTGGSGPDHLFGLRGDDTLHGGGGPDRLQGGPGDDRLFGDDGGDLLWGGTGSDTLRGGDGDDALFAEGYDNTETDAATDRNVLAGEAGNDSLYGGRGSDTLRGGPGDDLTYGGDGDDLLEGGAGADTLFGGSGNDRIDGRAGADRINAGPGDDTVVYDPRDPWVDGGEGNDLLVLPADQAVGAVVLREDGTDQVGGGGIAIGFEAVDGTRSPGSLRITGSSGPNRLTGSAFADTLHGGAGADTLIGRAGDDWLTGGAGDDVLAGGPGADLIEGEAGFDIADYSWVASGVTVSLATGRGPGGDTLTGIEGLWGGAGGDLLVGNGFANLLEGRSGADTLRGGGGSDTLLGGADDDQLFGGAGDDQLFGGTGDDQLHGGDGADLLFGGPGTDTLLGGPGNDYYVVDSELDRIVELSGEGYDVVLVEGPGYRLSPSVEALVIAATAPNRSYGVGNDENNTLIGNALDNLLIGRGGGDSIRGGDGRDTIYSMDGNDLALGEGGPDHLLGGAGDDTLDGGLGRDKLFGQEGDDVLLGGPGAASDTLTGGEGHDWLDGGPGADVMYGGPGNDTLVVDHPDDLVIELLGEGTDTVIARLPEGYRLPANLENLRLEGPARLGIGNALDNLLVGGAGADTLRGGAGDDTLFGGAGRDVLTGGAGRDTFVLAAGGGVDTITDFTSGTDRIELRSTGIRSFEELLAATRQVGADLVIDLGEGERGILQNVQKAALAAGDFLFAA